MSSGSSFRTVAEALLQGGAFVARKAYDVARDPKTHEALRSVAASVRAAFDGPSVDERLRAAVAANGEALLRADAPLLRDLQRHVKGQTVHQRVKALNALGLDPHNVLIVLGEGREVEAYFRARHSGAHLFGRDKVCTVCGLPRHAAPAACTPA